MKRYLMKFLYRYAGNNVVLIPECGRRRMAETGQRSRKDISIAMKKKDDRLLLFMEND